MNMDIIIIIGIILIAIILIAILIIIDRYNKYKFELLKHEIENKETALYNDMIFSLENIYNILDGLIEQYITENRLFNSSSNTDYITEKEANSLVLNVTSNIISELSPAMLRYLSLIFGKKNISNIINRRVIITVTKLVAVVNDKVKTKEFENDSYLEDLNKLLKGF